MDAMGSRVNIFQTSMKVQKVDANTSSLLVIVLSILSLPNLSSVPSENLETIAPWGKFLLRQWL